MAIRGVDFKWYDGFFLSMLATSVIIVAINWNRYHLCTYPLHIWTVVDYSVVFVFRLLMFVDNGLSSGMGLDLGWQQRYARFCGRIVVLSILSLLLYPFLWAWNVIGTLWFMKARSCFPEEGQKWGFLIWLLFSYCGLIGVACVFLGKWQRRRYAHVQRAQQGIPLSEYGILVDMIRVPDWAFEAAGQEMRGMGQDTAYHPGLYLTPAQREAVEALIQELPKFRLKTVPTDCSECPICLEEFRVGNEVRGLPCAHNFHVDCIDQWLRLNVKCPRCRCSVFPNLDLSALSNLATDTGRASSSVVTTSRYMHQAVPAGQSYLLRLQGLLRPIRTEHSVQATGEDASSLEAAEDGQAAVIVTEGPTGIARPGMTACLVVQDESSSTGIGAGPRCGRFCVAITVIGFVYSAFQIYHFVHNIIFATYIIPLFFLRLFDFFMDQILAYLLMSASSAAAARTDNWVTNWGDDEFTKMATASIGMSFMAFISFALSSLVSSYFLFNRNV